MPSPRGEPRLAKARGLRRCETLATLCNQEGGWLSPAGRRSLRQPVSSWCVAIEEQVQRILARSAGLDRGDLRFVAWAGRCIGARHPASSGRSGSGEQGALAPSLPQCPRCGELLSVGTSARRISRRLAAPGRRAPDSSGAAAFASGARRSLIAQRSRARRLGLGLGSHVESVGGGPWRTTPSSLSTASIRSAETRGPSGGGCSQGHAAGSARART